MLGSGGLAAGDVVAERFRLDFKLGEGGMGAVWAATHAVTGKRVAIKFLRSELAGDAGLVGRFIREARAACAVRHPNVVPIHDVLQLPSGVPIMVMDLLEGESLGDRLSRAGPLSVEELARIMVPVVSAIAAAHAASVVHRDLKPDNLFLVSIGDGKTDARVLDFGIAKVAATDEKLDPLTKTGAMMGTPYYMSPEQLFGERDVDHRTDVWALGIIFYECLSGKRPTEADNLGQIIKLVTVTGIPPLASVVPSVPADVSQLVSRMLMRAREDRPALADVQAALARYGSVSLAPETTAVTADRVVIAVSTGGALARSADSWSATHPTPPPVTRGFPLRSVMLFAALPLLLLLGTGVHFFRGMASEPSVPAATGLVASSSAPIAPGDVSALPSVTPLSSASSPPSPASASTVVPRRVVDPAPVRSVASAHPSAAPSASVSPAPSASIPGGIHGAVPF